MDRSGVSWSIDRVAVPVPAGTPSDEISGRPGCNEGGREPRLDACPELWARRRRGVPHRRSSSCEMRPPRYSIKVTLDGLRSSCNPRERRLASSRVISSLTTVPHATLLSALAPARLGCRRSCRLGLIGVQRRVVRTCSTGSRRARDLTCRDPTLTGSERARG